MTRNLFLFADGTGNATGANRETNVHRFYRAIATPRSHADEVEQLVHYSDGVGTSDNASARLAGRLFGYGLSRNILELYAWLIARYEPGDRIFLLGFSRGAYTVRCLAGLIARCGILHRSVLCDLAPAGRRQRLRNILRAYRASSPERLRRWRGNPGHFHPARTHFIGVFDTVDAIGVPFDELRPLIDAAWRVVWGRRAYGFHDRQLSGVEHARQAISLDDERRSFHPNVWRRGAGRDGESPAEPTSPGRIRQVWFAGAHANVGGGYARDGLALVALDWMLGELEQLGATEKTPVRLIPGARREFQQRADECERLYDARTGTGVLYRYSPRRVTRFYKGTNDFWLRTSRFGRPLAQLPGYGIEVHASIFKRIQQQSLGYAPLFLPDRGDDLELAVNYTCGLSPYSEFQCGVDVEPLAPVVAGAATRSRRAIAPLIGVRQLAYGVVLVSTVATFAAAGFARDTPPAEASGAGLLKGLVPDLVSPIVDAAFAHPLFAGAYAAVIALAWGAGRLARTRIGDTMRRAYDALLPTAQLDQRGGR